MKVIDISDPHRKKHFDFFRNMTMPHFSVVATVEIQELVAFVRENGMHFSSVVVYLLSRAANDIPELRRRIRGDQVIEHPSVHPSFTVETEISDAFSFCYVEYISDYLKFNNNLKISMEKMRTEPSFEDEEGRDDYLFLSSIPWLHFTSITHAMHLENVDSVPRITWGKYLKKKKKTVMPVSVQAHHAVVDGKHVSRFFAALQGYCAEPELVLRTSD